MLTTAPPYRPVPAQAAHMINWNWHKHPTAAKSDPINSKCMPSEKSMIQHKKNKNLQQQAIGESENKEKYRVYNIGINKIKTKCSN